jgi:Protein of unknown function (DUF3179)
MYLPRKLLLLFLFLNACATQPGNLPATSLSVPTSTALVSTPQPSSIPQSPQNRPTPTFLPAEPLPDGHAQFRTDFSRHTVPYGDILSGGPPKDGIPAVDAPQFISVTEAQSWLQPQEPVILVQNNEHARAYPIQIVIWHEIINDTLGDLPVAVTFCPLCNTAIVFDRRFADRVLDFGTTGRLRRSNLIMYDRQSESWWQQANGAAIAGEYAGSYLTFLPATIIAWEEFARSFPNGTVLSRETGHSRDYGRNPYPGYDDINASPFLYDGPATPDTLPATARVLTVDLDGEAVAYPYQRLAEAGAINDTVAGQPIVVLWQAGTASALDSDSIPAGRDVGATAAYQRNVAGQTLTFQRNGNQIIDVETGSTWNVLGLAIDGQLRGSQLESVVSVNHFWFSWAAFRPETRIYSGQ